jgi:RNA 3'-terminal phosphate cyclase (ATP)
MGPKVEAVLEKLGFYPAGGGRFKVSINPADFNSIDLLARGNIISKIAIAAVANLPVNIANRELKVVCEKLEWGREHIKVIEVKNYQGPGNVLTVEIESDNITEVFTGFGEKGVSAERVANRTVKSVREYLSSGVPVGRYLADQLLIPMAMAGGGKFRTLFPTKHTTTNIEVIKQFLDVEIDINEYAQNQWEIEIWNG